MSGEIRAYTGELVERLHGALGDDLVGVYVSGSYALGEYLPGRSDLDVMAVARDELPLERRAHVVERLRHESLPCPARGLEFVVYREELVRASSPGAGFAINLNTGREMAFHVSYDPADEPGHWFVIDRSIVRERGVPLLGPPPSEVFGPLPRPLVLEALLESLRWHRRDAAARPDDAVLNACRAYRYAAEGSWVPKIEAGRWAAAHLGDAALIETAIGVRRRQAGELDDEAVDEFLARVSALLERALQ